MGWNTCSYLALGIARCEREGATMLSVSTLKARGWTRTMIARFLGEPDLLAGNPHYACAAPMRLYAQSRVLAAKARPDVIEAKAVAARRSASAQAAALCQAEQLVTRATSMPITLVTLPLAMARARAIAAYNSYQETMGLEWYTPASEESDPAFLERITVNYIRHELMSYDADLDGLARKIGVHAAVTVIRRRVYDLIALAYPELAQECARQWQRRIAEQALHSAMVAANDLPPCDVVGT